MQLPEPSLALGKSSTQRPLDPTSAYFVAPALHALGERTSYRPCVFVPTVFHRGSGYDALKDEILRFAGFNPSDEASLPFSLYGSKPAGLYRRIWLAVQERSVGYNEYRPHKKTTPMFIKDSVKGWALTEVGVAVAARIRPEFQTNGKNVTGIWIDGQIENGLYEKMLKHLEHNPQLLKEVRSGEIADHLQTFLAISIRRNAFRSWLERGDYPRVRQMCGWAVRKAISTFRHYSQDAHHRTMRGALTSLERVEGVPALYAMIPSSHRMVIQDAEDENPESGEKILVNDNDADAAYHRAAWDEGMDRLRDAVARHKSGAANRYVGIFSKMAEGMTVEEIGDSEGVSRNRAATLMADTRTALRSAEQVSKDARSILAYIKEEPFATRADVRDDVGTFAVVTDSREDTRIRTRLKWILSELVARGRLEERNGSYLLTSMGQSLLDEWELLRDHSGDYGSRVAL